jgi:hypothetical protein
MLSYARKHERFNKQMSDAIFPVSTKDTSLIQILSDSSEVEVSNPKLDRFSHVDYCGHSEV